jgi:precorrin-6Y C5,15-methyltransferase (decarboxylating)
VVCSRVGTDRESVTATDLAGLAAGTWDPVSVVVLLDGASTAPVLAWGAPEREFAYRDGMITKAEVRAVALGKLGLPPAGVLWDVGAGSGSVAVECARPSGHRHRS